MSEPWEPEPLLAPISEAQPCGENLEDSDLLASFDTFRLFGEPVPLETPPAAPREGDEGKRREGDRRIPKPRDWSEWPVVRDKAAEALRKSKDIRLLATLGTALLRTNGLPAFCATLGVAARWLDIYWVDAYPRVDDDAMQRRNALNNFADPMAVVEGARRTPLVVSRQHGNISLRDVDIATRVQAPSEHDRLVEEKQVTAAFGSIPMAELAALLQSVADATTALKAIDERMRDAAGPDAAPGFDRLLSLFARLAQVLRVQLAAHPEAAEDGAAASPIVNAVSVPRPNVGAIASRQDAIRALDAVAAFFRTTEPSSPVPIFVERAKRLVDKDFLEVLADVVPEAVSQARAVGGIRDGE